MNCLQAKWFGLYFEVEDNPKLHNSIFIYLKSWGQLENDSDSKVANENS